MWQAGHHPAQFAQPDFHLHLQEIAQVRFGDGRKGPVAARHPRMCNQPEQAVQAEPGKIRLLQRHRRVLKQHGPMPAGKQVQQMLQRHRFAALLLHVFQQPAKGGVPFQFLPQPHAQRRVLYQRRRRHLGTVGLRARQLRQPVLQRRTKPERHLGGQPVGRIIVAIRIQGIQMLWTGQVQVFNGRVCQVFGYRQAVFGNHGRSIERFTEDVAGKGHKLGRTTLERLRGPVNGRHIIRPAGRLCIRDLSTGNLCASSICISALRVCDVRHDFRLPRCTSRLCAAQRCRGAHTHQLSRRGLQPPFKAADQAGQVRALRAIEGMQLIHHQIAQRIGLLMGP